ncbi:MAG TPA: lysophospholipid acyltransferase family protein [Bacteroidales bacterium]|nr:lysophospholipid acyltransferase family protein [Bacteroidales bacterium]
MKGIAFNIFFAFNYVITLLPLRVLYIFSDIFFVILFYFPSYRKDVVARNLRNAFPEKDDSELTRISRRYYRHLADLFVETLKVTHMSRRQISRRFRFRDMTLLDRFYDEGRHVVAICSHYNNWEWLSSLPLFSRYTGMTIYKPLKNKYFDRMMYQIRARYGVVPVPMQTILRELIKRRKENDLTVTAFIADQTPPPDEHTYWINFLNQETCFYTGPEKVAMKLDMAVVFVHIKKVRRGYYEAEVTLISENPKSEEPHAITERHIRKLEEVIREQPEYWLWSHRRWKHKRVNKND